MYYMDSKIIIGSYSEVADYSEKTLLRNAVRCKRCGDEIESKHYYDAVICSCRFVMIDGGLTAPRIIGKVEDIEYLYEFLVFTPPSKNI